MTTYDKEIKEIELNEEIYGLKDIVARETLSDITNMTSMAFTQALINVLYPVGSIYLSINNTAPFSVGRWEKIAAGRALVGVDSTNVLMNSAEDTFGSSNAIVPQHTHTQAAHAHTVNSHTHGPGTLKGYHKGREKDNDTASVHGPLRYSYSGFNANSSAGSVIINSGATGASAPGTNSQAPTINATGVSGTNQNYQPSIAVYVWKRVE